MLHGVPLFWGIVIAVTLLVHGIGHSLGLFPAFGLARTEGWSDHSWLLTSIVGESPARWISVAIWLVAMLGSMAAGLGLLGIIVPQAWWQSLAIVSAIVSLVGIVLFWNAFPGLLNTVGAIAVDVAILVALLWLHWPATTMAGS